MFFFSSLLISLALLFIYIISLSLFFFVCCSWWPAIRFFLVCILSLAIKHFFDRYVRVVVVCFFLIIVLSLVRVLFFSKKCNTICYWHGSDRSSERRSNKTTDIEKINPLHLFVRAENQYWQWQDMTSFFIRRAADCFTGCKLQMWRRWLSLRESTNKEYACAFSCSKNFVTCYFFSLSLWWRMISNTRVKVEEKKNVFTSFELRKYFLMI